jgi:hypothetical protein
MALLVDGGLTTVAALKEHDTGVLETATGEGIDLAGKLRLAENEVRADVERFLARAGRGAIGQVAVSESMRLWHAWKTLEAVYRDAYFSQLNDRYGARWKHYKAMAAEQRHAVLEEGIGLVGQPLRRPGKPAVLVESGALGAGAYQVLASAVNALGEESAASEAQMVAAGPGSAFRVTLDWLPDGATGWMVYAGTAESAAGLQTAGPLAPGEAFVLTAGPQAGRPPVEGQAVREWVLRTRRLG